MKYFFTWLGTRLEKLHFSNIHYHMHFFFDTFLIHLLNWTTHQTSWLALICTSVSVHLFQSKHIMRFKWGGGKQNRMPLTSISQVCISQNSNTKSLHTFLSTKLILFKPSNLQQVWPQVHRSLKRDIFGWEQAWITDWRGCSSLAIPVKVSAC